MVQILLLDKRISPEIKLLYSALENAYKKYNAEDRNSFNPYLKIVELLLLDERLDPGAQENYAIRYAAQNGQLQIVKQLLLHKKVNPADHENQALVLAMSEGHHEVVQILLLDKRISPEIKLLYSALENAITNNHPEIFRILLADKRIDPSFENNHALYLAASCGNLDLIKLLHTDERVRKVAPNNETIRSSMATKKFDSSFFLIAWKGIFDVFVDETMEWMQEEKISTNDLKYTIAKERMCLRYCLFSQTNLLPEITKFTGLFMTEMIVRNK